MYGLHRTRNERVHHLSLLHLFMFGCFYIYFFFLPHTFQQVVERNRALTQDLQRERAERQRVGARLLAAERGAEGLEAESLRDTVAALEVSS